VCGDRRLLPLSMGFLPTWQILKGKEEFKNLLKYFRQPAVMSKTALYRLC
jgi:hypothetical protein